jgi:hypothetical protein
MRTLYCSITLALGAMLAPATITHAASADDKPINANCPIGKEPIVPSAGTIEYEGKTIGLCCPGCGKAFLAWDENRRDAFVANVTARGGVIPIPTGHLHRLWREAGLDGGSGVADARGTTDHALLQRMREGVPG